MTTQTTAIVPIRKRFTVAEYYQMAAAGILAPNVRTELIDGEVILMPPIGPDHAWGVVLASELFTLWALHKKYKRSTERWFIHQFSDDLMHYS